MRATDVLDDGVRFWPNVPIDELRLNGRSRGIAAVGNAKLNGSKGTMAQLNDRYRGAGEATRLQKARQHYDDRRNSQRYAYCVASSRRTDAKAL